MLSVRIKEPVAISNESGVEITIEPQEFVLEHSLLAIFKWEEKYKRPFLKETDDKTLQESFHYYSCMCVGEQPPDYVWFGLDEEETTKVHKYLSEPAGGTTITDHVKNNSGGGSSTKVLSAEVIYAMMAMARVERSYENINVNRLLTILRIISIESTPEKDRKMSKQDNMAKARQIRAQQKARRG